MIQFNATFSQTEILLTGSVPLKQEVLIESIVTVGGSTSGLISRHENVIKLIEMSIIWLSNVLNFRFN